MATQTWQFLNVTINYNSYWAQVNGNQQSVGNLSEFLDGFGHDGWEMVSVVQNIAEPFLWGYFFKRPIVAADKKVTY